MLNEKMLKRGLIFVFCIFLFSCSGEDKEVHQIRPFELKKSAFEQLEGWEADNLCSFQKALSLVCRQVCSKKRNTITSDVVSYSAEAYCEKCAEMAKFHNDTALKQYIQDNFNPYLVIANGQEKGKFTAYYEAAIKASYKRGGAYQYPIYGKPKDLVEVRLRDFDESLPNQRIVGRVKDGKLVKYYTREEIDAGKIDAPVILWGDNPVDIYIMQIQGAAVATLPGGEEIRVGYADNNGHSFRGIGSILLEKGLIKPGETSMSKIRDWLQQNGSTAKKNMLLNDRYIFHKIVKADGPIGAMGLPLVAGRSLAVDRKYIPLGSIMWLETTAPDGKPLSRLVMAEDVGGAIKGGVRGDYFWGHGEEALEQAGKMNSSGRYFILLPKGTEAKIHE